MISPVSAAIGQRCPRCGQGKLYSGYMRLVEACSECGLKLAENDTGDGPAVLLIFVLGFTVVPLLLWIGLTFTPPLWLISAGAFISVIGTTLALLPSTKALFVAQNYRHNPWD